MPRFTQPPAPPDLHIIGRSPLAPSMIAPQQRITIGSDTVAYETLYSFRDASGQPVAAAYPGTYGTLVAARRRP